MRKRIMAMALMFLCVFGLIWGRGGCVASADTAEGAFSGSVGLLKQENDRYVMQVTVENSGEDFAGTVQVIFGSNHDNCAYNTEMTLPAQGKKQFTITVPERGMDTVYGMCALNFLDGEGNELQSIPLKNVLGDTLSGIPVGILSDNYSDLTFMDAGGELFYIRGIENPLDLVELNNDNLTGYLDGLYFLVIDRFNTSSLSEENIQAIQDWVRAGGWLIIGTGAYGDQTLSGFDEDFLDVDVRDVSEPGEENFASINEDRYGYYYNYAYDAGIDLSQMAIADLDYKNMIALCGSVSESVENPAILFSVGDGALNLLCFSLEEEELQKMSYYMIQNIYQEAMYNSVSYSSLYGSRDMEYVGQRALAFIDSRNSNVDFSWLEILIFVYVVLVGPFLYLILRKCKKSEWYWVGAPALGILFIAGVYFFGKSIRVNETKAYSVTVQQADGNQADTYLLAYHSGVKPWEIRLKDTYEVAGPGFLGYSYYNSSANVTDYHYIVGYGSKGMSVGLKPKENFESGYLYAGGSTEGKGTFTGAQLTGFGGGGNVSGTIVNETACDMAYMAVWTNSYIVVFSDVKAGESVDLKEAVRDGRCVYQGTYVHYDNLMYDLVGIYGSRRDYEQDDMAALLIGLGVADEKKPQANGSAVIAGVVRDYEGAVAEKCDETAYGCFYSYVQVGTETADDAGQPDAGGEKNASN